MKAESEIELSREEDSGMRRSDENENRKERVLDALQTFSPNHQSSRFEVTIRNLDHPAFPPAYRPMSFKPNNI